MATQAGEIEVKLTLNAGDFNKLMAKSTKDVQDFGGNAKAVMGELGKIFTFAAIANFFKKSIEAFAEQELASAKLVRALENQGRATTEAVRHLNEMASALEETTGIADEQITSIQALMTTFGLHGETLDRSTKAALDFSAAMGIDLGTAAEIVGKAFQGQTGQLSRYGIQINQALQPTERFAAVLREVEGRFGGSAQANAETFTGQIKGLSNAFNNLQETIGAFFSGPGSGLMTWLKSCIQSVDRGLQLITQASTQLGGFGTVLSMVVLETLRSIAHMLVNLMGVIIPTLLGQIPGIGMALTFLKINVDGVNKSIDEQINKWQATKANAGSAVAASIAGQKAEAQEFHNHFVEWKAIVDQKSLAVKDSIKEESKLRSAAAAEEKKAREDFQASFVTTEAQVWAFAKSQVDTFFQGVGDSFADMVMKGKSFGESMKAIWQDMTRAVLSFIAQMIAKMLTLYALKAAFGGGFGGPAGFSQIGGMMAEGGVIAEPSIITGLSSGRQILAGEAGPEAVVPMGRNSTASELGLGGSGGGGGGSININISGTFLEADENTWQRLMREKVIPEIRRFTMSSPTGPFNRRRGVV